MFSEDVLLEAEQYMKKKSSIMLKAELEMNICEQMKTMMEQTRDMGGFDPYPVRKVEGNDHEMSGYVSVEDRKKDVEV